MGIADGSPPPTRAAARSGRYARADTSSPRTRSRPARPRSPAAAISSRGDPDGCRDSARPVPSPVANWRDDLNAQPRAHAAKLGQRDGPRGLLLRIRLPHIDILPIRIERERHAVPSTTDATHRPPPRSFLRPPAARACGRSHRRPGSSNSPVALAPRTTNGNCHRAAPARRNAPCAPAAADGATACAPDSTPPASIHRRRCRGGR